MAPPALSTARKALFSAVVFAGFALAVGAVEGWLWSTRGPPPPHDQLARLSQCWIVSDTASAGLRCHPATEANVDVAREPTRPRVVALGGSSVRATWRAHGPRQIGNFPVELGRLLPGVEVVNLGVPGLGAGSVARLSSELSALQPDLVIIYSGHNDYNGDVFNGRIEGLKLWAGPWYRLMARSWIHAALFRGKRDVPRKDPAAFVNAVPTDIALRLRPEVDARFADDLSLAISSAPAPVVVSTLLRNPAFPPSGHDVRDHPRCADALRQLRHLVSTPERALAQLEPACGDGAVTEWLRFRIAADRGDAAQAQVHWKRSLDLDALPMRAPASADDLIRAVAADQSATLVDLEARFGSEAPERWFTDTLHLSEEGARAVARELAPVVQAALEPGAR